MRVALAGKGGTGKTTIAATLARTLARTGRRVVAIDADSNPNLAAALGLDREVASGLAALPTGLVSRRPGGSALTRPLDEILDAHAAAGPDGVAMTLMGAPAHAEEGCMCGAHAIVSAVLSDLAADGDTVAVLDLEASPEHFGRGTARHVDALLLVTEPYYRSLETIRRMAALAAELPIPRVAVVANKVRAAADGDAIAEFCARHDLDLAATVPWDDAAMEADNAGIPLLDHAPDSAAVSAITALAGSLVAAEGLTPA